MPPYVTDGPADLPVAPATWAARLSPHLRGHLFSFDQRSLKPCTPATATRLVLVFVLLEGFLGPRLSLLGWFRLAAPPVWIRVPALLALALFLVRVVGRTQLSTIGFRRWREWGKTERSYFIQVIFIAHVVFFFIAAHRLRVIVGDHRLWGRACVMVPTQLAWGIYQEVMYRGILQTSLAARWRPLGAILVANAAFTFGPLHFYHFASASALPMFVGIFAIGLFFSVLFWRSANLWMVGVLHGLGNVYMDGLSQLVP